MGSKSKSKEIMAKANVPCTPGFNDVDPSSQDPTFLLEQAVSHVGFPCLIKATMGKCILFSAYNVIYRKVHDLMNHHRLFF